jgi:signal transduction histidine kinase
VADVHELLHSTLAMFADRLSKDGKGVKAITVTKEFDRSLPEIPCYPGDLNQVWTNIIDNAIAAMRDEGGTLTIRTRRDGEKMARIEICDTGPGVPDSVRERIFEPFFTTKQDVGTGLGLWVTRGIVDRHGGTIVLRPQNGNGAGGAAFTIHLPVLPEAETADESLPA